MPRAWTENPIKRRISLAMLVGFVLKALSALRQQRRRLAAPRLTPLLRRTACAAGCETLPIGPWDRKPQPRTSRLGNYLDIRLHNGCGTCPERS